MSKNTWFIKYNQVFTFNNQNIKSQGGLINMHFWEILNWLIVIPFLAAFIAGFLGYEFKHSFTSYNGESTGEEQT